MSSDQIMSSDSEFEADPIKNGDLFQQILDKKTQHIRKHRTRKPNPLFFHGRVFHHLNPSTCLTTQELLDPPF